MPEGSAVPSVVTGQLSLRTVLLDNSTSLRKRQSHIEVLQSKVRDEGLESGAAGRLARYAQGQSSSHL
jgi:hypothetical protein